MYTLLIATSNWKKIWQRYLSLPLQKLNLLTSGLNFEPKTLPKPRVWRFVKSTKFKTTDSA